MKIDREKLDAFIDSYKSYECPLCHHNGWTMPGTVFKLDEFNPEKKNYTQILPEIPIICGHCGNTLFINAVIAGIVDSNDD